MVRPGCDESRPVPVAEVRPDSWVKRAPDPPKDDTVTLTKSQFKQILEVIGQVNGVYHYVVKLCDVKYFLISMSTLDFCKM